MASDISDGDMMRPEMMMMMMHDEDTPSPPGTAVSIVIYCKNRPNISRGLTLVRI